MKDQADCGSCWTFSSTGALEGQHKRATGKLISFSEQNLVDCVYGTAHSGCDGGSISTAFSYVYNNKGINDEASYPYQGVWIGNCKYDGNLNIETGLTCYTIVNGEEDLKAAIATIGPISNGNILKSEYFTYLELFWNYSH